MNHYDFDGRVALVTGGSGGMGKKTVERLRAGNASVAVFDRRPLDEDGVLSIVGDVACSADVEAAISQVEQQLGRLDILVCCAGIGGRSLRLSEVDDAEWERVFAINATGVFYCNRAAAQVMVRQGYGRIVNVASIAGNEGNPLEIPYSASKAAVIAMTKSIGKDLAGTGVLVNSIAPGATTTPMLEETEAEDLEYILSRIPLGRPARPDEIASLIAFLASEDLSFSTGACFDASGGRAVY